MINLMSVFEHMMGKEVAIDHCAIGQLLSLEVQQHYSNTTLHIECALDRANFDKMAEYAEVQEFFKGNARGGRK